MARRQEEAAERARIDAEAAAQRAAEDEAAREAAREAAELAALEAEAQAESLRLQQVKDDKARHQQELAAQAGEQATIDEAAVKSDDDILAASNVAALEGAEAAPDEVSRQKRALLDKVRLRLSDYE